MLPDAKSPLLSLVDARAPFPDACFAAPGGFAWWYLDVCDAEGNGLVLIPSWGLPFLPGRESAARRAEAGAADLEPSINVALYRRGEPAAYLLQRINPRLAQRGDGGWTLGGAWFRVQVDAGEVEVRAELDLPSPGGGRVQGKVHARGAMARIAAAGSDHAAPHCWGPVMPGGRATVDLRWDGMPIDLEGEAYLDRNWSDRPLGALGIRRWTWARYAEAGQTRIAYHAESAVEGAPDVSLAVACGSDGRTQVDHDAKIIASSSRRDPFGLLLPSALCVASDHFASRLAVTSWVDRGPFYARGLCRSDDGGHGFVEVVEPGRVDRAVHRPLVRMAVHDPTGANSIWLPLFAGPRESRWRRLLQSMGAP